MSFRATINWHPINDLLPARAHIKHTVAKTQIRVHSVTITNGEKGDNKNEATGMKCTSFGFFLRSFIFHCTYMCMYMYTVHCTVHPCMDIEQMRKCTITRTTETLESRRKLVILWNPSKCIETERSKIKIKQSLMILLANK